MQLSARVRVGSGLGAGLTLGMKVVGVVKESEGEHGAPEPLAATVVEPAKVIFQLTSS